MDIFVEKIVKKKTDAIDTAIIAGSIILAIALIAAIILMLGPYGTSLLLCAGIAYLTYMIIASRRVEFEYAFTNGELDIDKITSKRKRKRVLSANCREFEIFARADSDKLNSSAEEIKDRIMAVSSLDSKDIYFFIVTKKDDENDRANARRVIVFFEPDERMLKSVRKMIPGKVFE